MQSQHGHGAALTGAMREGGEARCLPLGPLPIWGSTGSSGEGEPGARKLHAGGRPQKPPRLHLLAPFASSSAHSTRKEEEVKAVACANWRLPAAVSLLPNPPALTQQQVLGWLCGGWGSWVKGGTRKCVSLFLMGSSSFSL